MKRKRQTVEPTTAMRVGVVESEEEESDEEDEESPCTDVRVFGGPFEHTKIPASHFSKKHWVRATLDRL